MFLACGALQAEGLPQIPKPPAGIFMGSPLNQSLTQQTCMTPQACGPDVRNDFLEQVLQPQSGLFVPPCMQATQHASWGERQPAANGAPSFHTGQFPSAMPVPSVASKTEDPTAVPVAATANAMSHQAQPADVPVRRAPSPPHSPKTEKPTPVPVAANATKAEKPTDVPVSSASLPAAQPVTGGLNWKGQRMAMTAHVASQTFFRSAETVMGLRNARAPHLESHGFPVMPYRSFLALIDALLAHYMSVHRPNGAHGLALGKIVQKSRNTTPLADLTKQASRKGLRQTVKCSLHPSHRITCTSGHSKSKNCKWELQVEAVHAADGSLCYIVNEHHAETLLNPPGAHSHDL